MGIFQIHQGLDAAEEGRALTAEVLERLALGAIIVDVKSRVMFANDLAARLLQAGKGLTVSRGCLRARLPDQQAELAKTIHDAALTSVGQATSPGGLVAVTRPSGAPLSVLVAPFRRRASPPQQSAVVLISDPDIEVPIPEQVLARKFALTAAEARLLSALVAGTTMNDYAGIARITLNTAKTQMRKIFHKTGYNRQGDIIRAVLADPLIRFQNASGKHAAS